LILEIKTYHLCVEACRLSERCLFEYFAISSESSSWLFLLRSACFATQRTHNMAHTEFNFELDDQEVTTAKQRYYLGTVRIAISSLTFSKGTRPTSQKIVKHLQHSFESDGCRRLEPANYLPAVIDEGILIRSLSESSISPESIRQPPENGTPHLLSLPQGYKIDCLHGRHRVLAAEPSLMGQNSWWTVTLYRSGEIFGHRT
jgi:hypothetical protein